jgi:hypothetical protein
MKPKNTRQLNRVKSTKIANATFEWCVNHFGNPLKSKKPTLEVSFDGRVKNYYGYYYERVIRVHPHICRTYKDVIRTVIHEYCHFLQMPKVTDGPKYDRLYSIFGYDEHPYEIEARYFETKYYESCYNKLVSIGLVRKK